MTIQLTPNGDELRIENSPMLTEVHSYGQIQMATPVKEPKSVTNARRLGFEIAVLRGLENATRRETIELMNEMYSLDEMKIMLVKNLKERELEALAESYR